MRKYKLSLAKLKEMQENEVVFYTAAGRKKLWIAEVDEVNRTIKMKRSTGKITWKLDYDKIEDVYKKIEKGELSIDEKAIGKVIPLWGNYLAGLFKYLGCGS